MALNLVESKMLSFGKELILSQTSPDFYVCARSPTIGPRLFSERCPSQACPVYQSKVWQITVSLKGPYFRLRRQFEQ